MAEGGCHKKEGGKTFQLPRIRGGLKKKAGGSRKKETAPRGAEKEQTNQNEKNTRGLRLGMLLDQASECSGIGPVD